jgi:hypothetical protein
MINRFSPLVRERAKEIQRELATEMDEILWEDAIEMAYNEYLEKIS